jgi:1-deoxy-D-xylulose-5-phosphate reductoisomerase
LSRAPASGSAPGITASAATVAQRRTRRIIVLGSTGSIGRNTLAVVEHLRDIDAMHFEVAGLAAGANARTLREQAQRFGVKHVAVADESQAGELKGLPNVLAGVDAAEALIDKVARPGDLVVGAMVGSSGVPATLKAVERGCDIALANKETLVAAGALVMPAAKKHGVNILPVDSEHSAVFQCLLAGRSTDEVARLVITASGGPFRATSASDMASATIEQALNHPTWSMGPKVTIDSASMMNKALEVIEAHWLFDLPAERIDVIVHPQSIVHSFVEFVDGSVLAQLGPPDMRTPIQFALTFPLRQRGCSRTMKWDELRTLEFEPVDHARFPAVGLANKTIEAGGTSGAILNAANEVAVEAFLEGRIRFGRISELVADALARLKPVPVRTLADVMHADASARDMVREQLGAKDQEPARLASMPAGSSPAGLA